MKKEFWQQIALNLQTNDDCTSLLSYIANKKNSQKTQQNSDKQKQEIQKNIKKDIEFKKKQMAVLQIQKRIIQEEKQSFQLARQKQQEYSKNLKQQESKRLENLKIAQQRAQAAYKRLIQQRQQASKKQKQANYRRQITIETSNQDRQEIQNKIKILEQNKKEPVIDQQKIYFNQFKKPLGIMTFNKNVDLIKDHIQSAIILKEKEHEIEQNCEIPNSAFIKAKLIQEQINAKKIQQQNQMLKQRKRQIQREREAIKKIRNERRLSQHKKQNQERLKKYNYQKVQKGKHDQILGLKQGTLHQMDISKKIRNQKQFQELFFKKQKKLQWISQPVKKYHLEITRKVFQKKQSQENPFQQNQKVSKNVKKTEEQQLSYSQSISSLVSQKKEVRKENKFQQNLEQEIEKYLRSATQKKQKSIDSKSSFFNNDQLKKTVQNKQRRIIYTKENAKNRFQKHANKQNINTNDVIYD